MDSHNIDNSFEVLKKAIDKKGVKAIAAALRLSNQLIYKWCQAKASSVVEIETGSAINPLDRIKSIYEATGDVDLINWVCKVAGGFFVKDPTFHFDSADREIFNETQGLIKEFSDTLEAISDAYNDDKKITEIEARRIRAEWEALKRHGEAFVRECESGRFAHAPKLTKPKKKKR